jgi:hypothetical protein
MSKLLDRLDKIGRGASVSMGFGAAAREEKLPGIALLGKLSGAVKSAQAASTLAKLGVDGAIIEGMGIEEISKKLAQTLEHIPWGVSVTELKNGQVGNYRDQGCDFLAFGPKGALLEALEEDDTGYILSIDPDMDERYLRTIEDLPVDAVLLSMKSVEPPLTVQDLITISSVRGNFSKYLLLEVTGGFSANELEGLRGIGVDALVVEATTLSAKKLQELRDALLALPKRQRSRSPRASAVLPRGSFVLPGASAGEEEYDDDDEYDE